MTSATILAANVPSSATEAETHEFFSSAGIVSKVHSPDLKPGASNKIVYVTYCNKEETTFAVKKLNKAIFKGNRLTIRLAYKNKDKPQKEKSVKNVKEEGEETPEVKPEKPVKKEQKNQKTEIVPDTGTDDTKLNRKARLIIRNLSFKASEEDIKQHFGQFGEISEVNVLKKEDGKLKGCCFVQYKKTLDASKALKNTNAQRFLGRLVAVDWALPKTKFQETKVKEEQDSEDEDVDNEEDESSEETAIKEEKDSEGEHDSAIDSAESDMADDSEDHDDGEDEDDEEGGKKKWEGDRQKGEPKKQSNDVEEGKTLFLRNISLETTQEELKKELGQFGRVSYALLCIDKMLERPRGTGFVKFQSKESADACLEASHKEGVVVDGRQLNISIAISRDELTNREKERNEKGKDKRNLYLAREGMIRRGTLAAEGVSRTDMDKRAHLDKLKRQLLTNLHMFISPVRLCVHHLPLSYDDRKLKRLFLQYAPEGAKVVESRVMKDFKTLDARSQPMSKGYGFVAFAKHEDALAALRKVNNNPNIFTENKRPIVEFSIENATALRAREKRLERSKEVLKSQSEFKSGPRQKRIRSEGPQHKPVGEKGHREDNFSGALSDPKVKGMPSHMGEKVRHKKRTGGPDEKKNKISRNALKKNKTLKRSAPEEREDTAEPPAKKTKAVKKTSSKSSTQDTSKFNTLVESYKARLNASSVESRKKWFAS